MRTHANSYGGPTMTFGATGGLHRSLTRHGFDDAHWAATPIKSCWSLVSCSIRLSGGLRIMACPAGALTSHPY